MNAKSWLTTGLNITEKMINGIPIKVYADRLSSLREVLRRAVSISPEKTGRGKYLLYRSGECPIQSSQSP